MWQAYAVLLACLVPVLVFQDRLGQAIDARRRAEFDSACEAIKSRAEVELAHHTAVLSGMRGLLAASTNVTPIEFGRYLASLDLSPETGDAAEPGQGLRDLGFALRVGHAEREAHTAVMWANGFTNYNPLFGGPGPDHFPVVYLDDFSAGGMSVSGWDIAFDADRLATLLRARDSGEATATPPITLNTRDHSRRTPGFVVYLPVYAGGSSPPTLDERRSKLMGFAFASFDDATLWRKIASAGMHVAECSVIDTSNGGGNPQSHPAGTHPASHRTAELVKRFQTEQLGRIWTLLFQSHPEFEASPDRHMASIAGALGLLISLGFFGMACVLIQARWTAERMADRISASEAQFRRIFDSIQDMYYRADIGGRVELVSPSCESVLGFTPSEIIGRTVTDFYERPDEREVVLATLLSNGKITDREIVLRHKNGHAVHTSLSALIVRDERGNPTGSEGQVRDITARKQAEAEHLRASKLESVGLLAGGIAHDFNNILTAILGNVALARSAACPGEPEDPEALTEIEKAALRARGLTHQLLTFAKGGAPVRQAASLPEIIRETVTFALRGSGIRAEFQLPADLWPAEVDSAQLHQVFHNISLNAAQAMGGGGTFIVRAENGSAAADPAIPLEPGPYVHCQLTDTGPGIPREMLPRIFDPYFTTKKDGNGLGLATAYSIVRRHDGFLTAESTPGVGTTFHIWLPASPAARLPDSTAPSTSPDRGSGRILIVDDEVAIRTALSRYLSQHGYDPVPAMNGEEAIRILQTSREQGGAPFRAAILDLTIPGGLGGRETLPRLREIQPGLPAVVCSGYSSDPVMAHYRHHGFDGVLAKPFLPADLARILSEVLVSQEVEPEPPAR
jgi:PAS domain S-box-containing protein